MMKVLGKGLTRSGKGYNNMDHMDKNFYFRSIVQVISRLLSISITNLDLIMFFQKITYQDKIWSVCHKC